MVASSLIPSRPLSSSEAFPEVPNAVMVKTEWMENGARTRFESLEVEEATSE